MDVVTDLSSQCVSFITVFQEICKERIGGKKKGLAGFSFFLKQARQIKQTLEVEEIPFNKSLKTRITEIICVGGFKELSDKEFKSFFKDFVLTCCELVIWVEDYREKDSDSKPASLFSSSYEWRQCIRKILYSDRFAEKEQRIKLVGILK